jgi:hypothetical protein
MDTKCQINCVQLVVSTSRNKNACCNKILDAQVQPAQSQLNTCLPCGSMGVGSLRILPGRQCSRSGSFSFVSLNSLALLWQVLLAGYARTSKLTGQQIRKTSGSLAGSEVFFFFSLCARASFDFLRDCAVSFRGELSAFCSWFFFYCLSTVYHL